MIGDLQTVHSQIVDQTVISKLRCHFIHYHSKKYWHIYFTHIEYVLERMFLNSACGGMYGVRGGKALFENFALAHR